MKILYQILPFILYYAYGVLSDCNVCQSTNYVACHKENVYSLCINGVATKDYITCPENHVCTDGPYVCYPLPKAKPSCIQKTNLCGVCSENKVYACVNETTIAFCYGQDKPLEEAEVSYCLGDTVCDIYSTKGFCTEKYLTKPSCSTSDHEVTPKPTTTTTETTATTTETTTTQTEPIITTTTAKPTITTTTTETTRTEPITTTTTTEPTATTSTTELTTTTITTITEPTTTITTAEPTTTTTTSQAPSKPRDPNTICKDAGTTGSFYADDPTCTTFVVCYFMSGSIAGLKKACPSGQYFPPGALKCAANKPDTCI